MTSLHRIAAISAAILAAAAASPAAAQGTGVDCIAATIGLEQLESLGNRWVSEEIGPLEVNEELRPNIQSCMDKGVIVTQPQLDASFIYAVAVIEIFNYGTELQSAGIDPSAVEGLWSSMPPPLRNGVMAYVANEGELPEEELKDYLAANSTADEAGKLGTALVFILAIASSYDADRRFAEASPQ